MDGDTRNTWRFDFATASRVPPEQFARLLAERKERDRQKDGKLKEAQQEASDFGEAMMVATDAQIAAFTVKLDRYDAATVEALQNNTVALEKIREKLDKMLLDAYVLPDGRRVFKSKDGTKVFDEKGVEVGKDVIDPAQIGDDKPTWEAYRDLYAEDQRLKVERDELLRYQDKIDEMRKELAEDKPTQKRLKELEDDLSKNAPESVRRIMGEPPMNNDTVDPVAQAPVLNSTIDMQALSQTLKNSLPTPGT